MHRNYVVFGSACAQIIGSNILTQIKSDMIIRTGNPIENSAFFRELALLNNIKSSLAIVRSS
jgi:hypothetical protein